MSLVMRNDFVVDCTAEQAFEFLSDLRNELKWNPAECESVEKITDGPVGLGTRFRAKWKGAPRSRSSGSSSTARTRGVHTVAAPSRHASRARSNRIRRARVSCRSWR